MSQLISSCNNVEYEILKDLCREFDVTIEQAIRILVRKACHDKKLPIEYDYENVKHLKKEPVPNIFSHYMIPMDKFIERVERGLLMEIDGSGVVSDGKYMYYDIICDAEWLKLQPKNMKYVIWFNK